MAHIHYKFASKRSSDTVIFDGPHVTLSELKRLIMEREKLRSGDCDLQITNAQTKQEFTEDEGLIAKGSSVIVRRIPVMGARSSSNAKIRNIERSDGHHHQPFGAVRAMGGQTSSSTLPLFSKMTNLAFVDASEEDKLKVLVNQSLYDSMSYNMKAVPGLPANYTCFRCGSTGHHIRNCPVSGDKTAEAPLRIKKSTGIPRSFMVEVDDPSIKGAMLTNCGHYAIPAIHAKAYAVGKIEKPPFVPQELPVPKDEDPVPKELLCLICEEMLSDAVVIPCCGNSFCDDCIRTALLDSEQHTCPTCKQSNVSPDTLIANKFLRQAVNTFQKDQGQSKSLTGNNGSSQSETPAWAPDPVLKKKPQQAAHKQQQTFHPQSTSPGCLAPPLTTGPAPPPTLTSTSLQPSQTQTKMFKNEPEEQPVDEAAAAEPSGEGSVTDAAAAVVSDSTSEERPPLSVRPPQSFADPVAGPVWPPPYWESSSSPSCPPSSSSSSTYPSVPPPLFPSPHFHSFLPAQHHLTSYPPGYPPATPVWSIQPTQGASIPPLCPSTHDWFKHQREKKETRSPHRGSSSRSKSSKSSRSYSRSSSRSRSRSRSVSRSRPQSPYSRSKQLHSRSQSSYTYSYGYKRSPTPSSSSSPRLSHHSRSKSPSDHRKRSHHGRHHGKKSSSGRRGERGEGERGEGEQRAAANASVELDRQRYLQWKRDYKEWCDKYFSSYVSHFHQPPPPLLDLPPSPGPRWEDREGDERRSSRADAETRRRRHHSRSAAPANERSTPSRSSSDGCSTASRSSSGSRSSPSRSSHRSRSPALSSDGCPASSKRRAAGNAEDGRKEPRRHPRTPGLRKASPCQPSEPSGKSSKRSESKRERGDRRDSERDRKQASRGADRGRHGNRNTDSRSEKPGKRRGDDARRLDECRSSKCPKADSSEAPRACEGKSQHPSDRKRSGKEKKTPPTAESVIWEEGMKVKPQKRISINISLEGRKKEENGQDELCPESSTGAPGDDVQEGNHGGEEEGGEAKEETNAEEREKSPVRINDKRVHRDQGTEEQEKREGWHCTSRDEEEEESGGLMEEHGRMKTSTDKEVTPSAKQDGGSGGQERGDLLTGENASAESQVVAKLSMKTEDERTGSTRREDSDSHGDCGNGLEGKMMMGAVEEHTQDRASEGEDRLKHVTHSNWEKDESEGKEQDEGSKESSQGSVSKSSSSPCGTAPPSGAERNYSSSNRRDWEVEMETDRSRQKQRRKEEESPTDGEGERSERSLRDEQGKIQDTQLHHCCKNVPGPSHNCTDTAAGKQLSPPTLLPSCWGGQKGPLPSEGLMSTSKPHLTAEKMDTSTDSVVKVCRLQGDHTKKKGGQQGDATEEGERAGSSSVSQESRKERDNERTHKMEKREADHEPPEDWDTHNHKRSKKSREGREH